MLKHILREHTEIEIEDVRLTFKVARYHQTPLSRMIHEALEIKRSVSNPKRKNMNSKIEYCRKTLPDITDLEDTQGRMEEEEIERLILLKKKSRESKKPTEEKTVPPPNASSNSGQSLFPSTAELQSQPVELVGMGGGPEKKEQAQVLIPILLKKKSKKPTQEKTVPPPNARTNPGGVGGGPEKKE